MQFPSFETFYEGTADLSSFQAGNGPGYGNSSNVRDSRIAGGPNPTGLRTGTKNNPGASNTVSQSNVNTQTPIKNRIDKVSQNPNQEEVLSDMDMQQIQNTNGIDISSMKNDEPMQINSKTNAAVVKSVDATGKPVFKLMHYQPIQQQQA